MNSYEGVIIVKGKLEEKEVDKLIENLEEIFKREGGEEVRLLKKEKKKFSYPIKKFNEGYYLFYKFRAPPTAIEGIKTSIKHNELILRSSFLKEA